MNEGDSGVMVGIDAGSIHVFQPSDVLIPAQPFVNAEIDNAIPESGFVNGARFHPLVPEFAGEARITL